MPWFRRGSLALVLCVLAGASFAQEAPVTKEARARQLLVLMRTSDMGVQIVDSMIQAMKDAMPGAGDEFWTAFRQQVKGAEFVDMLVPVYANNLEVADLEELIRFYSSPAGQRFLDKQPVILQESMAIGQKWGEQLARRAIEELKKSKENE